MYKFSLFWLFVLSGFVLQAQQPARTFYFMDNAPVRLGLNPALQPQKGFFSFPFLGGIGVSAESNALSVKDFTEMLDSDNGYLSQEFLNKLKDDNYVNSNASVDLISFGFYSGKGFWTVDIGVKMALTTSVPRSMFEFIREADMLQNSMAIRRTDFEIHDMQVNMNAFGQVGLGYSRPVTDWLTVGGKVKFLLGLGNVNMDVREMKTQIVGREWQISTRGQMNASLKGLKLGESQDGYIDDFDFDSPGISGYGAGFDLGMSANFFEHLNVSAAVTDIGFIKWSSSATTSASTDATYSYPIDDEFDVLSEDLFQFRKDDKVTARTTRLYSNLNLGAEYRFFRDRLGVGLLSSTTFYQPTAYSELTASVNYCPGSWFGAALSYSFLHSDFKTLGVGLRLGPVFLATDYLMFNGFETVKCANAYFGISFPLGSKKVKSKKVADDVIAE